MKKDKVFEILNGEKPSKSVLSAAYAELDASRAAKKPDRRNKLALKWAAGILVPLVTVSVVIAIINPFGGAKSSAPNNDNAFDMSEESAKNGAAAIPFSFNYDSVAADSTSGNYMTDQGETISVATLSIVPERPSGAVDITVDALGVLGYRFFDGERHNIVFKYGDDYYIIQIQAAEERLQTILSDIRLN